MLILSMLFFLLKNSNVSLFNQDGEIVGDLKPHLHILVIMQNFKRIKLIVFKNLDEIILFFF